MMWKWTTRWFTLAIIWDRTKYHIHRNPKRKEVKP